MRSAVRGMVVAGVAAAFLLPAAAVAASAVPASAPPVSCAATVSAPSREAAFTAAAVASGVPETLLKAVSYMRSRWEDHGGRPSSDGGYGLFGLRDQAPERWDGSGKGRPAGARAQIAAAAELTGLPAEELREQANAGLCGGAALLAAYHRDGGGLARPSAGLAGWQDAVTRLGGTEGFAAQVYHTLRQGQSRVTGEGERVTLAADPSVTVPAGAATSGTDCPAGLDCERVDAPYAKINPADPDGTTAYGNHDIADRTGPGGPRLRYIVIHDTEGYYAPSLELVQDPAYLAWNYTIRSADGHVAQHLDAKDVGWHAGNWYVNMHAIGIEHEGFAGTATWYTESMYQSSAALVRHLAAKYGIPLDRAHVIGHDQVPGTVLGATKNVHWDPGPYWDWEHYFELLGAPIGGTRAATAHVAPGDVVEVRTGYAANVQPVTGCAQASPGSPDCVAGAGTNFLPLRQAPSADAPLAKDPGWKPDGAAGSTYVSDISARVTSGQKLVVARVQGEWLGVWWAGSLAWLRNPADRPVAVRTTAKTVTVRPGAAQAAIYGRAYPEAAAYAGTGIPVQALSPLEYTVPAGQEYAVSDADVATDYYRAVSFDGSAPGDRTDVRGQDRYLQLWYAHRQVFVRAAEVDLHEARTPAVLATAPPAVSGTAKVGRLLTASPGGWSPAPDKVAYQWLRDGAPIKGAKGKSLRLTGHDLGRRISVRVTASAAGHQDASATSEPTAPVRAARHRR
ncbi:amidase [Sphaerisporangium melleum]|uniref:N-acetylmuramoyl-L-alanine amidase n=1 Tax=Sphaerisporangium melleum TaxID=321316 RepID=A0A917RN02_9ACTN|nr:peptidoglycan recognition family protein [Sphaerisporangium melleum]GGL15353.1 amidase [Sphaerisporangium melleum]GII74550.1 amidase [Sphaerisporangium melleum]